MKSTLSFLALLSTITLTHALTPHPRQTHGGLPNPTPRILMAGDSTMVATGNNDGTNGWGLYLSSLIDLPVLNYAVAGRSARSFTREGRFQAMLNNVTWGDYVIIEFGHNDPLAPTPMADNGRGDCPPGIKPDGSYDYSVTCVGGYTAGNAALNFTGEVVHTFYEYEYNATKLFQAKGAKVVISTQTTQNLWQYGNYSYPVTPFVQYARDVAHDTGAAFVDHQRYMAEVYKHLGKNVTDGFYPHDHTHTSPPGASTVAMAFVWALEGATGDGADLKEWVGLYRNETIGGVNSPA